MWAFVAARQPQSGSDNDSINSDGDSDDEITRPGVSTGNTIANITQKKQLKQNAIKPTKKAANAKEKTLKNRKLPPAAGRDELVKHLLKSTNEGTYKSKDSLHLTFMLLAQEHFLDFSY